jgi:hypothetical protein
MTYTTVSDAAGTTTHSILPAPVYNATAGLWSITIDTTLVRVIPFYIKATNEFGNEVVTPIMYADVVDNCFYDVITLNVTAGDDPELSYVNNTEFG